MTVRSQLEDATPQKGVLTFEESLALAKRVFDEQDIEWLDGGAREYAAMSDKYVLIWVNWYKPRMGVLVDRLNHTVKIEYLSSGQPPRFPKDEYESRATNSTDQS